MSERTIKVDVLARVEGEGSLYLRIKDGRVEAAQLKIFEPPRFFEAFLRGRAYSEAPDITARICGICPVAYQMSSVHAIEQALGVIPGPQIRQLRRLLYCGEWIESHALHVFMLHAPDFLGYPDAVAMAGDHGEIVKMGLAIKKAGNAIVTAVGGREIHPINVKVGGFFRAPETEELARLVEPLEASRMAAHKALSWAADLRYPDFERDYEFVALRHASEYPFNEGRLASSRGLDVDVSTFEDHFRETHEAHSNALHCEHIGHGSYFVGPLARYNLNFDRLPASVQDAAVSAGLTHFVKNPFQSILVRLVELLFACEEALRIIGSYKKPEAPAVNVNPGPGIGSAITEAPRGILYHRYQLDEEGFIKSAKIVPPTSQNQKTIEQDLMAFAADRTEMPDEALTLACEQAIRNYDPCISCATHFLKLDIERSP